MSYLVSGSIPPACMICKFAILQYEWYKNDDVVRIYRCSVNNKPLVLKNDTLKPKWCPLKKV